MTTPMCVRWICEEFLISPDHDNDYIVVSKAIRYYILHSFLANITSVYQVFFMSKLLKIEFPLYEINSQVGK